MKACVKTIVDALFQGLEVPGLVSQSLWDLVCMYFFAFGIVFNEGIGFSRACGFLSEQVAVFFKRGTHFSITHSCKGWRFL